MPAEVFVGTSGWLYDWNREGTFDWYVRESGLNAVELNASFYRLPFRNQVKSWSRKGGSLRWAVKVHRYITHYARLSEKATAFWFKFRKIFEELDEVIDFYLLQLPPSFSCTGRSVQRLKDFVKKTEEGERIAVEFRHPSWFLLNREELCRYIEGATAVSVDSPEFNYFIGCGKVVYARLHGRTSWYFHEYSSEELLEVAKRIIDIGPSRVYVFFNNDHWMLENARQMLRILQSIL